MRKRQFIEHDTKECIINNIKIMLIFIGSLMIISAIGLIILLLLNGIYSGMCGEAGKTDTGGWAVAFISILAAFISVLFIAIFKEIILGVVMAIFILHSVIISLFIKLHEKLFDNIKASIGLIICNIIIACILQKFLDCNGIIYFLMSLIAVAISIMIRYRRIKRCSK
ncbi:hypothetical protein NNC19_12910 [Clostridium sp. SHJSY1]|uniref:hypothetical protein n=1 Tax=Clostridium sp. SHJSY1 TaxID=2942483 RepID=UPI002876DD50|nr:hypothetical protein [Clostridium sp. SHJSY1]MDS0526585.1 hypothetical protein [Clostridium sp. SHJSY1]